MAVHPAGATPPPLDQLLDARPPGYFTDDDLDTLPESHAYEIVDGVLLVNPPPGTAHQRSSPTWLSPAPKTSTRRASPARRC